MDTKEEVFAKLDKIKEEWVGLDRNPSADTILKNDRLRDIWKKTLTMSHGDYMKKISIDANARDFGSKEAKALRTVVDNREDDPAADDANREKMKKGLKDGSLKPKTNVYQ